MSVIQNWLKPAFVFTALLSLGACGTHLGSAQKTTAPGTAFESGLHQGYIGLSQSEYDEGDYRDSDTFADRAIAVSGGTSVAPEEISARALPDDHVGDLSSARARLVSALDATARTKVPGPASRAQVMFDCWMEEQEENFQPKDIARCRGAFESAMAEVDDAMRPPPPAPKAAMPEPVEETVMAEVDDAMRPPPPAPKAAMPEPVEETVMARFFTIFFDFDSSSLNPTAQRVVEAILADWGSGSEPVSLVGHTDSSGSDAYNQKLSERRVTSVRDALENGAWATGRLSGRGVGESNLLVPTPDGVREPQNRRVTVTIQ